MKTLYLNKTGHKWRNFDDRGNPEKVSVFCPTLKTSRLYTVAYWEALGNYAVPFVKTKGKVEQLCEWDFEGKILMINNEKNRNLKWGRI